FLYFFFSSRRRHTRFSRDWSSDVCSSDLASFQLVSMLPDTRFRIALSVGLYTEWQAVLTRPEHLPPGATAADALAFLRYLASIRSEERRVGKECRSIVAVCHRYN